MQNAIVIRGRLVGPRNVELDEPVSDLSSEVEVIVRAADQPPARASKSAVEFLRGLPAGTRTREDIDHPVHAERRAWEDR